MHFFSCSMFLGAFLSLKKPISLNTKRVGKIYDRTIHPASKGSKQGLCRIIELHRCLKDRCNAAFEDVIKGGPHLRWVQPLNPPCQTLSAGNLHTWQVWTTANPVKPWHHQGTSSSPFSTLHFRLRKRSANSFSWQRVSEKFEALSSSNCIMAGLATGESLKSKSVCCLLAMQQAVKWGAGSSKNNSSSLRLNPLLPSINQSVSQSIKQLNNLSINESTGLLI